MSHVRVSEQLVRRYTSRGKLSYISFVVTLELDRHCSTLRTIAEYARLWGVNRATVRRLISDYVATAEDLKLRGVIDPGRHVSDTLATPGRHLSDTYSSSQINSTHRRREEEEEESDEDAARLLHLLRRQRGGAEEKELWLSDNIDQMAVRAEADAKPVKLLIIPWYRQYLKGARSFELKGTILRDKRLRGVA